MNKIALDRISKVIQTESTTPSIGDFLLTHVPFENLSVEGNRAISENELLEDVLLADHDKHKFILVQGSNGSGKSHLIRWLKEKYLTKIDINQEKVLLISRAHNTLQDALTQLLESDIFPDEIKENELKQIKNARSNITGEELNKTINFNFTLEIEADENNKDVGLDLRTRNWLTTYLNDNFVKSEFMLIDGGPIERIRAKIETTNENIVNHNEDPLFIADDFNITIQQIKQNLNISDGRAADFTIKLAEKFADERNGKALRQKVADYLNIKVSNVIQRSIKLQTADFKKLFVSLRKILKNLNVNLTLFIEDINSFAGIDEALMEVLLTDHTAEGNEVYCRIISVVGSTTAFYNTKLNDSIKERIKTNISIKEKSVLGTKVHLSKFAAKYINAINITNEMAQEWIDSGANEDELPVFESTHKWANVNCDGNNLSIFPFNQTALWNFYESLDVDKKTPRVFLKSVIAHALKLWFLNSETFLSDENNFSNADIQMPPWKDQLYNKANTNIDEDTAIERGILLKIWGDGTAKVESGRLGSLTSDVFKSFGVYANIKGEAKAIIEVAPLSDDIPSIVEEKTEKSSKAILIKNQKLIKLEGELENWITPKDPTKNKLPSHVEFREYLQSFIVSGIDWELEGVPMLLVKKYMDGTKYVFIEGQITGISDGFLLERNYESYELLVALANWKYSGLSTWHFDGSADYLTGAIAWLERHKDEIIKAVVAPKDNYEKWDLALWNVSAMYCIKTLFGGLDISKPSEDIAIELLGLKPDFNEKSTHSEAWEELQKIVLKSDDYKNKIVGETLAYFSKSVGSKEAGATAYVFIDALDLLKQIKKLKSLSWNLDTLCTSNIEIRNSTWYYSANFINVFNNSLSKIIFDENEKAKKYILFFNQIFDNNFDEDLITASLQAIKDFLKYLTEHLNLSYAEADFKVIKAPKAANTLVAALNRIQKLDNTQKTSETLMKISKNPFDNIENFYVALLSFNKLLNEKESIFEGCVDIVSKEAIEEYRKTINEELDKMCLIVEELGGVTCGNN